MAEDDGVKMCGLRLGRPAAPRLGCAGSDWSHWTDADGQAGHSMPHHFIPLCGGKRVRPSAQRGDGRTVVFPLPFLGRRAARV